jgi:hypothetical protein
MFEYAVQALHMSESEAGLRIRVSRLGRQFPVALEMLARGELHLTALKLLAPVLTRDNLWLLEAARFKSKQQVLELLARQFPKQDAPSLIRRLPGPSLDSSAPAAIQPALLVEPGPVTVPTRPPSAAERAGESGPSALPGVPLSSEALAGDSCEARVAVLPTPHSSPAAHTGESSDAHVAAPSRPPSTPAGETSWLNPPAPPMAASSAAPAAASCAVPSSASSFRLVAPSFASRETPLSSGRYKVQFTADQRLRDKLEQARELLRHRPTICLASQTPGTSRTRCAARCWLATASSAAS